eukprot:14087372-Alexandrium_andersonii.AAC.1
MADHGSPAGMKLNHKTGCLGATTMGSKATHHKNGFMGPPMPTPVRTGRLARRSATTGRGAIPALP